MQGPRSSGVPFLHPCQSRTINKSFLFHFPNILCKSLGTGFVTPAPSRGQVSLVTLGGYHEPDLDHFVLI